MIIRIIRAVQRERDAFCQQSFLKLTKLTKSDDFVSLADLSSSGARALCRERDCCTLGTSGRAAFLSVCPKLPALQRGSCHNRGKSHASERVVHSRAVDTINKKD